MNARAPAQVADPSFRILQDIAKDLAKGDISFPTFSAATVEVRKALEDPNVNADKLARVVSREPLLSAKLILAKVKCFLPAAILERTFT